MNLSEQRQDAEDFLKGRGWSIICDEFENEGYGSEFCKKGDLQFDSVAEALWIELEAVATFSEIGFGHKLDSWLLAQAVLGEAANIIKKLDRIEDNTEATTPQRTWLRPQASILMKFVKQSFKRLVRNSTIKDNL